MVSEKGLESTERSRRQAAMFVDFEQMLLTMKTEFPNKCDQPEVLTLMLHDALEQLTRGSKVTPIIRNCYMGAERRCRESDERSLSLMGFELRFCLQRDNGRNASMQIPIDVLHTLHTRPEISRYVLAVHDQAYIPLVRALQIQCRSVQLLCLRSQLSGDLHYVVGDDNIIEMTDRSISQTGEEHAIRGKTC
jgi:hypothetical protein